MLVQSKVGIRLHHVRVRYTEQAPRRDVPYSYSPIYNPKTSYFTNSALKQCLPLPTSKRLSARSPPFWRHGTIRTLDEAVLQLHHLLQAAALTVDYI